MIIFRFDLSSLQPFVLLYPASIVDQDTSIAFDTSHSTELLQGARLGTTRKILVEPHLLEIYFSKTQATTERWIHWSINIMTRSQIPSTFLLTWVVVLVILKIPAYVPNWV